MFIQTLTTLTVVACATGAAATNSTCCYVPNGGLTCPSNTTKFGTVSDKTVCCDGTNYNLDPDMAVCVNEAPDPNIDPADTNCCMTPSAAPACPSGFTLTKGFMNDDVACCQDTSSFTVTNDTPQCAGEDPGSAHSNKAFAATTLLAGTAALLF